MKTTAITALGVLVSAAMPTHAFAQAAEGDYIAAPVKGPRRAFELSVGTGFTQGFGDLYQKQSVGNVARAGVGVGATVGYRSSPEWSVGAYGQFQDFAKSDLVPLDTAVRGATVGIEATFHAAPFERVDPWLSLGTGYRMLWEVPTGNAPTVLTQGFELGRLQIGLDLRPNDSIGISPVVGGDVNVFAWQTSLTGENASIPQKRVSAFVFAGLQGRFDVGGARDVKLQQRTGSR